MAKIQKLFEIGKAEQGVPVHPVRVPVHFSLWWGVPVYPCTCTGMPSEITQILLFSPTFDANSFRTTSIIHKHFKTTSNSSYDLFSTQFIIQSISFIKTFHDFLSKPL